MKKKKNNNLRLPFDARVKYVEDNLEKIIAAASDPVNVRKLGSKVLILFFFFFFGLLQNHWWIEGIEDPWQALATSIELTDAIKSGNPETFVSHLPIHQVRCPDYFFGQHGIPKKRTEVAMACSTMQPWVETSWAPSRST